MSQLIEVPGFGPVEFPDDMDDASIAKAIRKNSMVRTKEPEFEREAKRIRDTSYADVIAGSVPFRLLHGPAAPFVGVGAKIGGLLGNNEGLEKSKTLADMERRGRAYSGIYKDKPPFVPDFAWTPEHQKFLSEHDKDHASVDTVKMGGSFVGPAPLAAAKLPIAASTVGKVAQGSVLGALFGLTNEVTGGPETALEDTLSETGVGATIGGAIPVAGKTLSIPAKAGYHALIEPWLDRATIQGRAWLEAAGDKADEVINLLRQNKQLVPGSQPHAGQAAAAAGVPEFNAMVQSAATRVPHSGFEARADQQNLARLKHIGTEAKDAKALRALEETRQSNAAEGYSRELMATKISPKSEEQLLMEAAAAKGREASGAVSDVRRLEGARAAAEGAAQNWYPTAGQPRAPGRYSYADELAQIAERKSSDAAARSLVAGEERRFIEGFANMLREAGNLNTTSLHNFLSRPSVQKALEKALQGAKETGAYFPKKPSDPFSVGNLQRMKQAINDVLEDSQNAAGLQATERKEISDTLSKFVGWLSMKSPKWKAARAQYASDSLPINQMQTMQYLESVLKPTGWQTGAGGQALNQRGFLDALRKSSDVADTMAARRAADLVQKKASGTARYGELEDYMNPLQMGILNDLKSDFMRNAAHEGLAKAGATKGLNAVDVATQSIEEAFGGKMPNPLHRGIMLFNQILSRMEGKINRKMAAEMAAEALNPPKLAETMAQAKARQEVTKAMTDAIMRAGVLSSYGGVLSTPPTPQGVLAR